MYRQLRGYRHRRRANNRVRTSCHCFPYCYGDKYVLDCGHVLCTTGMNRLVAEYNPDLSLVSALCIQISQLLQPDTSIRLLTDGLGHEFRCFLCNRKVVLAFKINQL